jgi:hypothetical protein
VFAWEDILKAHRKFWADIIDGNWAIFSNFSFEDDNVTQ